MPFHSNFRGSTMDIEKIKKHLGKIDKIAHSGKEYIQDCESFLDYGYYAVIKDLYTTYKVGGLSKEECIQAKEIYQKQYIEEYTKNHANLKMYEDYQKNLLKSSTLRCEINGSNDIKKMLLKSLECITLMTGDEVFYKVNSRKIME